MRRHLVLFWVFGLAICIFSYVTAAGPAPATQPSHSPDFVVSDMRVQTLAGFSYLYSSSQTTFDKIGEAVGKTLPQLEAAMKDGKFHPTGPLIFTYRDVKDMSQPFTLDIGYAVPPETAAFGDFKLRKEDAFKCATVIYSGPIMRISEGFQKLMTDMTDAKLTPAGPAREYYLYWEGMESPNNVVLIQIAI